MAKPEQDTLPTFAIDIPLVPSVRTLPLAEAEAWIQYNLEEDAYLTQQFFTALNHCSSSFRTLKETEAKAILATLVLVCSSQVHFLAGLVFLPEVIRQAHAILRTQATVIAMWEEIEGIMKQLDIVLEDRQTFFR